MNKSPSRLRGERSTAIPLLSWVELKTLLSSLWQKLHSPKSEARINPATENAPPVNKPVPPYNSALLFYFVERGRRSYEDGISFAQWSDKMRMVHGRIVIPYLKETWELVKKQTVRTSNDKPMKTKVIIATLAAFILISLFPPWQFTTDKDSVNGGNSGMTSPRQGVHSRKPAGYALLLTPPINPDNSEGNGVQIDLARLLIEMAALAALSSMAWILMVKPPLLKEGDANRSPEVLPPLSNSEN